MQPYLRGKNREIRKCVAKFRTGSHWLEIQRGRFTKPQTEREDRLCKKCNLGLVEDEVHVVFICPLYELAASCPPWGGGVRSRFPVRHGIEW
jgi:hypothetical protein